MQPPSLVSIELYRKFNQGFDQPSVEPIFIPFAESHVRGAPLKYSFWMKFWRRKEGVPVKTIFVLEGSVVLAVVVVG